MNWCLWTVVLEKTLESPLDCKEIQPVLPKGDQSWVFIGRTDLEAETPILWPPDAKSWLIGKDPDAGREWGQEEKGMTEDEMVGWHHLLNGHWFGWSPGIGDGGRPGVLRLLVSQRIGHDWATELNWAINRKTFYVYRLEDLTLLKWLYFCNWSINLGNLYQNPTRLLCRNWHDDPKIHLETQRTQNNQKIFYQYKMNEVEGLTLPEFKNLS